MTASKHRIIHEAGVALGVRDGFQKPIFKVHVETGATWASLRKQNRPQPASLDMKPQGTAMVQPPFWDVSPLRD